MRSGAVILVAASSKKSQDKVRCICGNREEQVTNEEAHNDELKAEVMSQVKC